TSASNLPGRSSHHTSEVKMSIRTQQTETAQVMQKPDDDQLYEYRIIELRKATDELAATSDDRPLSTSLLDQRLDLAGSLRLFGVAIGTVPTAAILFRLFVLDSSPNPGVLLLAILATAVTGLVGYLTAGGTAKALERVLSTSFLRSLLLVPIIGLAWGVISGAAGGLFLFVLGALVGGVIGGMVAGTALPLFVGLFSLAAEEGEISIKRFLPIAAGISGSAAALFLGA
ncbi:MAG TPA: hypothetical protein PKE66_03620, partial [Pyrinomonadaceae bacterium]|nr:hypothetical protein [Pyrinomonadaceae bacterium]